MIRILHLADLHVSASRTYAGIRVHDAQGRNQTLADLEAAVADLIAQAKAGGPLAGCIVAGDVFDTPRPTPEEIRCGARILRALAAACDAQDVLVVSGNHDAVKAEDKPSALAAVELAPWVVARDVVDVVNYAGAQWVCLPYPRMGAIRGAMAERNLDAAAGMSAVVGALVLSCLSQAGQRAAASGLPLGGLVAHADFDGATIGVQPRSLEGDVRLSREAARHFPAVMLGHIHRQQAIPGAPNAAYPGSPVVCDFGEEFDRHGAALWTFPDATDRQLGEPTLEFLQHAGRLWETIPVGPDSFDTVRDDFAAQPAGPCVWRVKGTLPGEQFRALRDTLRAARARGVIVADALELQREERARLALVQGLEHPDDAALTCAALAQRGVTDAGAVAWLRQLHGFVQASDALAVKKEGGRPLALVAVSERPSGLGTIAEGDPEPVPTPETTTPAAHPGELF